MGLIESITGKFFQQIKDFLGLSGWDIIHCLRLFDKGFTLLRHLLDFLFSHSTAQNIGLSQAIAGNATGCLHHLLLVNHDSISLLTDVFKKRVRVLNSGGIVLTPNIIGDKVHRSRAVKSNKRYDFVDVGDTELAAEGLHATGFQLKNARGLSRVEQFKSFGVIERDTFNIKV